MEAVKYNKIPADMPKVDIVIDGIAAHAECIQTEDYIDYDIYAMFDGATTTWKVRAWLSLDTLDIAPASHTIPCDCVEMSLCSTLASEEVPWSSVPPTIRAALEDTVRIVSSEVLEPVKRELIEARTAQRTDSEQAGAICLRCGIHSPSRFMRMEEEIKRPNEAPVKQSTEIGVGALRRQIDRLRNLLEMVYARWDSGESCYDYEYESKTYIGNAVRLEPDEQDQIIAAIQKERW